MDLGVSYLGLQLKHPFVMGASPLVDDLAEVRKIEDNGAAAIVMHSLFEEQLSLEQLHHHHAVDSHGDTFGEALSYMPEPAEYHLGPHEYLEQIRRIKDAVDIPVIGSLNGTTPSGWLEYASLIESAGADALEMNVYGLATDATVSPETLEAETIDIVRQLKDRCKLPVALKLSPFYTSLSNFAWRLVEAGADALVLFNRFYQPDIDIEELEVKHVLKLSDSSELLLRLRWLAILSGQIKSDYAITGGVHTLEDAIKSIMVGAHSVQMVSEVLRHGPECFNRLSGELAHWLMDNGYESLEQMRGSMNLARTPDPRAYERGNYIKMLQSWQTSLDRM